ncbi:MAG: TIR domain-containing protein [Clostridia bacterium]|nr:TIR domain-containing protein [Clostridia bacterium]
MGYAFISYSSKDRIKADELRNLLISENIDCRMAPYDIHSGSNWAERLTQAIKDCACVVLLLSDAAQKSKNVNKEINLATTKFEKDVISIKLEAIELNDAFTYYLSDCHVEPVKSIDKTDSGMVKVLDAVKKHTGVTEVTEAVKAEPVKKENKLLSMAEKYDVIITDENGYKYEGRMKDGKYHGKGTLYRPDGSKLYDGNWVDGKKHGKFNIYNDDGSLRYEAEFDNDIATVVDKYGYKYVGQMKDGKYHGEGTWYRPGGWEMYKGNWVDGKRHGKGIEYHYFGSILYDGDWVNGKRHGKGTWYSYDRSIIHKGEFENGKPKKK